MNRFGTTEEQAAAILFLTSDEAPYVAGVILLVAGGDVGRTMMVGPLPIRTPRRSDAR